MKDEGGRKGDSSSASVWDFGDRGLLAIIMGCFPEKLQFRCLLPFPLAESNYQSWAHRSYILSERSKAMSDL